MRQAADRSPVARLARLDADGLEEHRGGNVVRMGDERDGHPGADGLIGEVDPPRRAPCAIRKNKCPADRQREGDANG